MGQSGTRALPPSLGSQYWVPAGGGLAGGGPAPLCSPVKLLLPLHPALGAPVGTGLVAPNFFLVTLAMPLFLSEAVRRPSVPLACITLLGSPQPDGADPAGPGRDWEGHHTNRPPFLVPLFTGHLKATLWPLGPDVTCRRMGSGPGRERAGNGEAPEVPTGCPVGSLPAKRTSAISVASTRA